MTNRTFFLKSKPAGKLAAEDFELRLSADPVPEAGEVLIRNILLSIDAANRAWLDAKTYRDQVRPGDPMPTYAIAEVIESCCDRFVPGDIVVGESIWSDRHVVPADQLSKAPKHQPLSQLHSLLGIAGLTAYFGLLEVAQPKAGETVVVSAAAGSVGSIVGQIAKIQGCRVIGITGDDKKGHWLVNELGFDAFVNYKAADFQRCLRKVSPAGIDVYFDNVGGWILETVLKSMNLFGRVACCGAVSGYDKGVGTETGVPGILVVKRLTMRGFIVMDFSEKNAEAIESLKKWASLGLLKVSEDIIEGLEKAPEALIGLLNGENIGKRMVRVAPDPV